MAEPILSLKIYVGVLGTLIVLALLTWGLSYVDLERWNLVLAMAIAVAKMMLVVVFFMHGWFMPRISKLAFAAGLLWLGIMVALTMGDYLTRNQLSFGGL